MKNNNLRIKEILKEKKWTIEFFAEKLGISRVTLSNKINGNPTLNSLQDFARYLEVPFCELFKIEGKVPVYFNGDFYCTKNENVLIIGCISNSFLNIEFLEVRLGHGVRLEGEQLEKFIYSEVYRIDPFPSGIISPGLIEYELILFNTFKKMVNPTIYKFITQNIENFFSLYRNNKGKEIKIKITAPEELENYIYE